LLSKSEIKIQPKAIHIDYSQLQQTDSGGPCSS